MSEWIFSPIKGTNYILDDWLKDNRRIILVAYEKASGRRYVKQVECFHGRVTKKINGKVIAWMPLPDPPNDFSKMTIT